MVLVHVMACYARVYVCGEGAGTRVVCWADSMTSFWNHPLQQTMSCTLGAQLACPPTWTSTAAVMALVQYRYFTLFTLIVHHLDPDDCYTCTCFVHSIPYMHGSRAFKLAAPI